MLACSAAVVFLLSHFLLILIVRGQNLLSKKLHPTGFSQGIVAAMWTKFALIMFLGKSLLNRKTVYCFMC